MRRRAVRLGRCNASLGYPSLPDGTRDLRRRGRPSARHLSMVSGDERRSISEDGVVLHNAGRDTAGEGDASQQNRLSRSRTGALQACVAAAVLLIGCAGAALPVAPAAPPAPAPCPPPPAQLVPAKPGDVLVNGMLDCEYANGVLSGCVLLPGTTLDGFATSTLAGLGLSE